MVVVVVGGRLSLETILFDWSRFLFGWIRLTKKLYGVLCGMFFGMGGVGVGGGV